MFNVIAQILRFLPLVIQGIEIFHGPKNGEAKFAEASALADQLIPELRINEIKDPKAFADGKTQVINGIVKMLNASIWYKS